MQCTAQSKRTHERCRDHAMKGRKVCYHHGGNTPVGPGSPQYRTGRYSKFLPSRMFADYQAAGIDPELMSLRKELAVLDARLIDVLKRVDQRDTITDGPADDHIWRRITTLIDQRRRLVESEQRRLTLASEVLYHDQAMALMGQLIDILRRHVTDRDVLAKVARDMQAIGSHRNGHAAR